MEKFRCGAVSEKEKIPWSCDRRAEEVTIKQEPGIEKNEPTSQQVIIGEKRGAVTREDRAGQNKRMRRSGGGGKAKDRLETAERVVTKNGGDEEQDDVGKETTEEAFEGPWDGAYEIERKILMFTYYL